MNFVYLLVAWAALEIAWAYKSALVIPASWALLYQLWRLLRPPPPKDE